jgi:hypothetical protein
VLGAAVDTHRARAALWIEPKAELGGDDHALAHRRQGFTGQLLIGLGPVDLRRIEEGNAALHRIADESNHLLPALLSIVREPSSGWMSAYAPCTQCDDVCIFAVPR